MEKLLIIILLFSVSPSYAMEMHHAVVLEHKSEISGGDNQGRAIDGHIEAVKNSIAFAKQKNIKKTPNKR